MLATVGARQGAVPVCLTDRAIPFEVAVGVLAHARFEVSTALNMSPSVKLFPTNDADVAVATAVPLMYHWYDGDEPPLVEVAMNVTGSTEQVGLFPPVWAMETEGANDPVNVMALLLPVPVPHALDGDTDMFPPVAPKLTVMLWVLAPVATVAPVGNTHV